MEKLKCAFVLGLAATMLLPAGELWSAEVDRQVAYDAPANEPINARENGGYLELGIVALMERRALAQKNPDDNGDYELGPDLYVSGGYQYERLFLEATESWFGGLNLGVNLLQSEQWSVDLLMANIAGTITIDSDEAPPPQTEIERNDAILDRDSLYVAAGTRITGYFGDNIVQLRLLSDWYDDNGVLGSARVGRQWQIGNWNLQGVLGARYYSTEFNNYLYGVSSAEATTRFPRYRASSAWIPELELSASVPISKDWVYTSRLRFKSLPGSITDSPIVSEDTEVFLLSGVQYVF